jgi:hypothetical protein
METDSVEVTIRVPAWFADPDAAERARLLLVLDRVRHGNGLEGRRRSRGRP